MITLKRHNLTYNYHSIRLSMTKLCQRQLGTCRRHFLLVTLCLFTLLAGCSSREQVRHLASDASLIVPQQSTATEVISLLGQPDQRRTLADETEEWIYYYSEQSLLRKTPFIGKKIGHENYDLIIIYLKSDRVTSSTYRLLSESEFKSSGIKSDNQLHAE